MLSVMMMDAYFSSIKAALTVEKHGIFPEKKFSLAVA